jgi:hypothetical protein
MPAGRVTDRQVVVGAAGLTAALGLAVAFLGTPESGVAGPSSYSAAAAGGKAAYETLAVLGHRLERSYEPVASLRVEPAQTTLIITGGLEPSDGDRRALRSFVEAGGEVLLVGVAGAQWLDLQAAVRTDAGGPVRHRPLVPSALSAGVSEITMRGDAGSPRFGENYVAVFAVNDDRPLVATARRGAGRVTWWADPTPLANLDIADADNLRLLLNVAGTPGARRVLWDEHYHGTSRSLWSYLVNTPLPWAGAQLAVLAIAGLVAYSRRSGPVRARASSPRTSPLEFIEMLGEMYRRAGARHAAVATARTRLLRAATSTTGVPSGSSDHLIARAVAARTGAELAEIETLLAQSLDASTDPSTNGETALVLITALQQLTARLRGDAPREAMPATTS